MSSWPPQLVERQRCQHQWPGQCAVLGSENEVSGLRHVDTGQTLCDEQYLFGDLSNHAVLSLVTDLRANVAQLLAEAVGGLACVARDFSGARRNDGTATALVPTPITMSIPSVQVAL